MSEVCCSDPFAFRPLRITTWPPRKSQQEKVSTQSSLDHIVCLVLSWTMLSQEINSMDKTVYSTDCSRKRKFQPKVLSQWHRCHFPKLLSSKTIKNWKTILLAPLKILCSYQPSGRAGREILARGHDVRTAQRPPRKTLYRNSRYHF